LRGAHAPKEDIPDEDQGDERQQPTKQGRKRVVGRRHRLERDTGLDEIVSQLWIFNGHHVIRLQRLAFALTLCVNTTGIKDAVAAEHHRLYDALVQMLAKLAIRRLSLVNQEGLEDKALKQP